MSGMKDALCPLRMNVVSANAASPRGAGSAAGTASTRVGRGRSSARTAIATSFVAGSPAAREAAGTGLDRNPIVRAATKLPCGGTPKNRAYTSGLEVVRVVRENFAPILGDEHEVLEPAAAVAVAIQARLDRDHVACDELAGASAEPGFLVYLEPHSMAERVVEAVLEHLAGLLGEQRRVAVLLEHPARDLEELAPRDTRLDGGDRLLKRLAAEPVVLAQLLRRLANDEDPSHVGEAGRFAVAGEEVEADGLVRRDRAGAHVVADRGLGAVRDDELVRERAVRGEGLLNRRLQQLARERLSVDGESAVLPLGRAKHFARGGHSRLGGPLGATDAGELRLVLDPAAGAEAFAVGSDLDPVRPQMVGDQDRERARHDRLLHAEAARGTQCDLELDLLP